MSGQKIPFVRAMNQFAERKVADAIQVLGKGLPCSVVSVSGAIVTVKFEVTSDFTLPQVTIPLFGPEYIRYPIKAGDLGVVIPMDARLSGVSGIGGAVPDLSSPANLTALVFLPIGNTEWSSVDANAVTIYGPNGVVLRDTGSGSTFVLTPTSITMIGANQVKVSCGGTSLTMTSAGYTLTGGTGAVSGTSGVSITDAAHSTSPTIMNAAWAALVTWLNTHEHTSAASGSPTSVPITPFSGGSIAP